MRLAKFLAHAGVASRRAAEQLVFAGRVTVGGEVVRDPARDVSDADEVAVDDKPARLERRHVVFALNKPAGYVSTVKDPQGRPTVVALIGSRERLYPVGRLDVDTTGLLLLTNDGDLAQRLTHPSFEVPRVYRARVRRAPVREPALRALREGVTLDDGVTAPAQARRLAPDRVEITLHEGRKRQVRRMLDAVGHPAISLERVAIGPLWLGDLPLGKHRRLRPAEVEALRRASRAPRVTVPAHAPDRPARRQHRPR
jgi:23S rRNA pseudouridine2605 synthase